MTCIVAVQDGNDVWMGADSRVIQGWNIVPSDIQKIVRHTDLLIGGSGDARILNLIAHHFILPKRGHTQDADNYIFKDVIQSMRQLFKDHAVAEINLSKETTPQNNWLVGYSGGIYAIDGDYCVTKITGGIWSIGCGHSYAKGALSILKRTEKKCDPEKWITAALEISAQWNAGISPPFIIQKL